MKTFRYEGARLREISFPVGGIGAGAIGLAGNGALIDWEIRNHPDKGVINAHTHFAVKAVSDEGVFLDARVLQGDHIRDLNGVYEGNVDRWHGYGYGVPSGTMAGFPHFETCAFIGSFPTARVEFSDEHFPGKVALDAFSSFIPLASDDSGLPCAFYAVSFTNDTDAPLTYTAAFTLGHLEGDSVSFTENASGNTRFGFHAKNGDICVSTDAPDCHIQRAWYRSEWFEAATLYWRDFSSASFLPDRAYPAPGSENGTLEARVRLLPGETGTLRFLLSWYFPVAHNYWEVPHDGETEEDVSWRNYYATRFSGVSQVSRYCEENYRRLKEKTYAFRNALYSSTLPDAVLDAVGSCLSVLVTPVTMRLTDGSFYGWEGANEHGGSCEGSCQHVWNYAYAIPLLFPDLEKSVRRLEARYSQHPDGRISFRLHLPPGREEGWIMPCVDGQMGYVMKVYHAWKQSGDDAWLREMWPSVKKAVRFAWSDSDVHWDPERRGILSGRQHHTLDREFFGPSSWLEGFYLGALDAAARMAEAVGEDGAEYREVYDKGVRYLNNVLFNGEYYSQQIDLTDRHLLDSYGVLPNPDHPRIQKPYRIDHYWSGEYGQLQYQLGDGCLLDQALAQWHMNLMGLSHPFEKEKLLSALRAIFKNNYRTSFRDVFNPCRVFCLDGERGTQICTYPEGHTMPAVPIPYCQEVMTGFEYAAAGLMLTEGMRDEAETMIRAIRDRYDGAKRNPWNEIECGSNYSRCMAAFALTHIYAGFTCDMTRRHLSFRPLADGDFAGVWFTAPAWGRVEKADDSFTLTILSGSLPLSSLSFPHTGQGAFTIDGASVQVTYDAEKCLFPAGTTVSSSLLWKR